MKVTLTSNLTLLTRARAKALLRHKVRSISTSLDSSSPRLHDQIRGVRGSFKRTLRGMELVRQQRRSDRTRLRVNFVIMRRNFREYPDVVRLAAQHGASDVVAMPVDTRRSEVRLSKRLIREYNATVAPAVARARAAAGMSLDERCVYPFGRERGQLCEAAEGNYATGYYRSRPCYAPFLHLFVAWDGKVYPCCMTNGRVRPLGDLRAQSVGDVFGGDPYQRARAELLRERLPSCHACDMYLEENHALAQVLL
jgi:MoaA/NifB/PqqE/SkfB family radical SAM enzyme